MALEVVSGAVKGFSLFVQGVNILGRLDEEDILNSKSLPKKIGFVLDAFAFGCQLTAATTTDIKFSMELQGTEAVSRLARVFSTAIENMSGGYDQSIWNLKIMNSILAAIRVTAQFQLTRSQYYLSLPPSEFEKVEVVSYDSNGDSLGYHHPIISEVELIEKHSGILLAFSLTGETFGRLGETLMFSSRDVSEDAVPVTRVSNDFDPTDFVSLSSIPTYLENDPILSENVCPITGLPIRHPVSDPVCRDHVYEERAIRRWLERNPVSPLTRKPMSPEDLMPRPDITGRIEERLNQYRDVVRRILSEGILPS